MILITAFGSELTHARAERLGAVAVLDKPFDFNELLVKVREVLFW
jgi:DNA-binding response OmpR family regulator